MSNSGNLDFRRVTLKPRADSHPHVFSATWLFKHHGEQKVDFHSSRHLRESGRLVLASKVLESSYKTSRRCIEPAENWTWSPCRVFHTWYICMTSNNAFRAIGCAEHYSVCSRTRLLGLSRIWIHHTGLSSKNDCFISFEKLITFCPRSFVTIFWPGSTLNLQALNTIISGPQTNSWGRRNTGSLDFDTSTDVPYVQLDTLYSKRIASYSVGFMDDINWFDNSLAYVSTWSFFHTATTSKDSGHKIVSHILSQFGSNLPIIRLPIRRMSE